MPPPNVFQLSGNVDEDKRISAGVWGLEENVVEDKGISAGVWGLGENVAEHEGWMERASNSERIDPLSLPLARFYHEQMRSTGIWAVSPPNEANARKDSRSIKKLRAIEDEDEKAQSH